MKEDIGGSGVVNELITEVEGLNVKIVENSSKIKMLKRINCAVSIAILIVFVVFGIAFYGLIKQNFTRDKLLKSAEERALELQPTVAHHLAVIANATAPVYLEEGRKQFSTAMPKMLAFTQQEVEASLARMAERLPYKVEDALKNISSSYKTTIRSLFPALSPAEIAAIEKAMEDILAEEFENSYEEFFDAVSWKWDDARTILDRFDNPALPNDERELLKLCLHYSILLLDKEIMEVK